MFLSNFGVMVQFVCPENIHILVIWPQTEKRPLTKQPISGGKWFMGIKSDVFYDPNCSCLQIICPLEPRPSCSQELNLITWDSWMDMKKNWSLI